MSSYGFTGAACGNSAGTSRATAKHEATTLRIYTSGSPQRIAFGMRPLLLALLVAAGQAPEPEARSLLGRPLFAPAIPDERRQRLEKNLAQAEQEARARPDDADALIWLGRRTAYLGRFREAIAVFTRGLEKHPRDPRFLRHRGHRYVSVRELDKAVADLERAGDLLRWRPDEVEPDGEPNALGIPTSTL